MYIRIIVVITISVVLSSGKLFFYYKNQSFEVMKTLGKKTVLTGLNPWVNGAKLRSFCGHFF